MAGNIKIMVFCVVLLCSLVDSADVSEEPAAHIFCLEEKLISTTSLYLCKLFCLIFWFLFFGHEASEL
jgi:hypothetical protein